GVDYEFQALGGRHSLRHQQERVGVEHASVLQEPVWSWTEVHELMGVDTVWHNLYRARVQSEGPRQLPLSQPRDGHISDPRLALAHYLTRPLSAPEWLVLTVQPGNVMSPRYQWHAQIHEGRGEGQVEGHGHHVVSDHQVTICQD